MRFCFKLHNNTLGYNYTVNKFIRNHNPYCTFCTLSREPRMSAKHRIICSLHVGTPRGFTKKFSGRSWETDMEKWRELSTLVAFQQIMYAEISHLILWALFSNFSYGDVNYVSGYPVRTNPLSSQNPIYPHFLVLIIVLGTHGPRQKLTFGFKVMEIIIIYINLLLCLIKANYITWFTMARQLETSWNPERRATISTACRTSRAFSGSIFGSSPSGSTAPDKLYASVATATIWPHAPARKTCKNRDNRLNVWRTVSLMNMGED